MTDADKRRIIREASKGLLGSSGIVEALQLPVKPGIVRQLLQETACLRYKRFARTPAMREHHEKLRVKWATERMTWNERKWNSVVRSDQKNFNLDGPNGLAYKWHDLRKQEWFSKKHSGGASVMVWACFTGTDKSPLVFLEEKQGGTNYINTLEDTLLPFSEDLPLSSVFMQDSAPCHRVRVANVA